MTSKDIKLDRLKKTLMRKEPDIVPVSDFFWTGFIKKAKTIYGDNFDAYRQFDLDYVVVNPNMDPHIKDFEVLEDDGHDILIKTGFEANIRRREDLPMPHFESFSINDPDQMEKFQFDRGDDERRFYRDGDDQINCIGDAISRNISSWDKRVNAYCKDFPVFGSICEPYEFVWRIIGTENALLWMAMEEDKFKNFIDKIGKYMEDLLTAQIKAGNGRLSGMYIWGDVAYVNGMLFNPNLWRKIFKPHVKNFIKICHDANLSVIYHGCGNATPIYNDFIEIGLDGYNPLEAKAGLDIVELKKEYGERITFVGNFDVRVLESGDKDAIKQHALYKMQAASNGGWICQSDHSVSSDVNPLDYAYMVDVVREYGKYPINMKIIEEELKNCRE